MGYVKWSYDTLNTFCHDVFRKFGFNEEETNIITDVLLTADLYGIESHGMQRMVRYDKGIEKGTIHPDAKPEVVFETPVSAVIDGHDGMGQLISHFAMEKAIEKAKKTGVGFVSVRNSNHFGIAGYYAEMASKQGLLGMACTNSEAIMVPTFGRKAMLGSNPIAVAMPAEPYPFLFDCSTTVVTRGKLEMYNKMGKPLPQGWALGANGQESTDAPDVLANIVAKKGGGIMPLGGNKEVIRVTVMECSARFSAPSFPWVLLLINAVHLKTRQVSVMDLLPSILQSSEMQMISGHIFPNIWKLFVRVQRQKAQSRFILMVRRKYLQKKSAERMAFL